MAMKYRAEILLGAILLLSAFLNLWNIWNGGISNAYYASAVKSALVNPVAGFFNSLDPAGFITVDKPPVGIWVQALFAAVLGFSGWTIILPQALAGVASVALIYVIVSRPFGKPAGLVAAFALAVTPISVAIARNGTMDMQMIFVILLAVWAALKAARERSLPWLLASAVLVGIGFNIKMIQAFIVVPAILAVWLLGATDLSWQKRVLHLGIAVVILLAVSLSWALVVDSIPADQRPFIGGSGDNTVMGLIVNYNGAHRLGIGESGGGSGSDAPGSSAGGIPGRGSVNRTMATPGSGTGSSFAGPDNGQDMPGGISGIPDDDRGTSGSSTGALAGGMGGGGGFGGGSPGLFRIFANDLAGDIAWLLMFALIGTLAWVRRPRTISFQGIEEAGYLGEKGLTLLAMLLWLVPGLLYFSMTSGFWHDYYIATIAPPLAALVGIGAVGMYRGYLSGNRAGWFLVIAVLVTGLIQAWFLSSVSGFAGSLLPLVLIGTLAGAGLLALMKVRKTEILENHRWHIIAVAIAILFIAPFIWSCTLLAGDSGNLPSAALSGGSRGGVGGGGPGGNMPGGSGFSGMAGPGISGPGGSSFSGINGPQQPAMAGNGTRLSGRNATDRSGAGTGPSGMGTVDGFMGNRTTGTSAMNGGPQGFGPGIGGGESSDSRLSEYLLSHTSGETWILAVPSSHNGANLIIETGKPVMCLGGFSGSDQVLDVSSLQRYLSEGKVRYFLGSGTGSGGGGPDGGNSEIFSWVSQHCTEVPADEWGENASTAGSSRGNAGSGGANTLYDCAGYTGKTSV
jgi:4-amino-4-deoxy-L-arabinose transferase-like glycosyltransferase